mgnify:CR=1 FL=1
MAISQAMCTSFKKELLEGTHNFLASGGNSFKLALYTNSASLVLQGLRVLVTLHSLR